MLYNSKQEFITAVAPAAVSMGTKYHYLPSVLIAQACLENGYGMDKSCEILVNHNNLLGIKAELLNKSWADKTVWNGEKFLKNTPEVYGGKYVRIDDYFRAYKSFEQCFEDYCLFMTYAAYSVGGTPKYRDSVIGVSDPEKLITAVNKLGYATDPNYSKSVMRIINDNNLTTFDYAEGGNKLSETIKIIDNTKNNTPPKWGNTREALVFHYLGVKAADNPNLYNGGYGGQWYISRKGDIYHSVKEGGVVWAVGSGGWGLKGTPWTNYNTESVEMGCECDGAGKEIDDNWWFHMATQEAAVKLARYWLEMRGYGVSEASVNKRILIHNSITNKPCPAPWVLRAGYQSPNEKGHRNWSFEEFKKKIWQGYDGSTKPSSTQKSYLSKGDKGAEVTAMQKLLIAVGYPCGAVGADGDFGNGTELALKDFQMDYGLVADGLYGNASKAKLTNLYNNSVIIGSARTNEYGTYSGGAPGDQTGKEVSTQLWYLHQKGWVVARAKSAAIREKIAKSMQAACDNRNIGYDDSSKSRDLTAVAEKYNYDLSKVSEPTSTNCAQLVRLGVLYAGIQVGDFFTGNMADILKETGQFEILKDDEHCTVSDRNLRGDILITKTAGHTVVVLKDGAKASEEQKEISDQSQDRWYRVRKTWEDAASQMGAYRSLDNAINACPDGYSVFDEKGNKLYPLSSVPYMVKITDPSLNFRQGPGVSYPKAGVIKDMGIYTIVEEKNGWGKLKSGAGWINLKYSQKL
jgi:hypothetical protein